MSNPTMLFDRRLLRTRRTRALHSLPQHDFMFRLAAERLTERLEDITRDLPLAVTLGGYPGLSHTRDGMTVLCDEEWLPLREESADLIVSPWSLHWVNDLPGALVQIRRALKPDGLFLAVLPGANSLMELRASLAYAQSACMNGAIPQVAPLVDVRDAGNLLQRAGFTLPVADSETLTITYESPLALMRDLRGMGETNMLHEQYKGILPRSLFPIACDYYTQHFPAEDGSGRVSCTVELVTLTGWAPHPSQPQPARRGSGQMGLGETLM